jgi:hypothetical protein
VLSADDQVDALADEPETEDRLPIMISWSAWLAILVLNLARDAWLWPVQKPETSIGLQGR